MEPSAPASPLHDLRRDIIALARTELNAGSAERDREQRFPHDLWRLCGGLRLPGLLVPAEYGGRGLDAVGTTSALEAFGYACTDGGLTFSLCAHLLACVVPICKHGTEAQKRRYLPGLSDGTLIAANAMTEPESGSDAFALRMRADRDGDGFRLSGRKVFVSNGPVADVVVTYAATDPGKGYHGGVTAFLVERDTPGFGIGQRFDKLGLRTSPMSELVFDNVRVPDEGVLGAVGIGAAVFAESMDWERACLAASHVGTMERLLEQAIGHTRPRRLKTAGAAPAAPQAVANLVANMKVRLEAARGLTYRAATRLGRRDVGLDASIAKLFVSEALVATAHDAMHVLGAPCLQTGHDVERVIRDATASTIYSGTSQIQRNIISRWLGV